VEAVYALCFSSQNIWVVGVDYSTTDRFIFGSGHVKGVLDYLQEHLPFLLTSSSVKRRGHKISLTNGSEIKGKSAKYEESFVAEPVNLIIGEDAASFHDGFYDKHLRQRTLDTSGKIILNSVPPVTSKNWLTRLSETADGEHLASFTWSLYDNPHIPREELARYELDCPPHLRRALIEGKSPTEDSTIFGKIRDRIFQSSFLPYHDGDLYQAGVDIGKVFDRTVLTISDLTRLEVVYIDIFPPRFFQVDKVEARLLDGLAKYNFPNTYIDMTGIGQAFTEMVARHQFFIPYYISTLKDRNTLIEHLALMFARGLSIPLIPQVISELEAMEIVMRQNYYIYRPRNNAHDDTVISMALSLTGHSGLMAEKQRIHLTESLRGVPINAVYDEPFDKYLLDLDIDINEPVI